MMSAIRAKDTKPELAIRRGLHALGFRYQLHSSRFAGKPDMLFPKYRAVIFVHGCYWHGHNCGDVRVASSNKIYWSGKIARNRERDAQNLVAIATANWRSLVIWECAFRRRGPAALEATISRAAEWLREGDSSLELCAQSI